MIVIGLTGSIGMGKSTTAGLFAEFGVPVYDADAAVHALYASGGDAVKPLGEIAPLAIIDNAVCRSVLKELIAEDSTLLQRIESVVHPLLRAGRQAFLEKARAEGHSLVVLDIPLLFETKGEKSVDAIVVVSASAETQRKRVLERPGMTEDQFAYLLSRQVQDAHKRANADYVVLTDDGIEDARRQVETIILALNARSEAENAGNLSRH